MLLNTRDSYGLIDRLLHWLIAALVIGNGIGGEVLSLFESGGLKNFFVWDTSLPIFPINGNGDLKKMQNKWSGGGTWVDQLL